MPKIVTTEQMKLVEAAAHSAGVTYADMMENAGRAVAEAIIARMGSVADRNVVVLVGSGNNGGDGLVAGYHLAEAGAESKFYLARPRRGDDDNLKRVRDKGLFIAEAENDQRWRVLKNLLSGADVVIDAALGTGAQLPVTGQVAEVLAQAGALLKDLKDRARRSTRPTGMGAVENSGRPLVVSVDCPSGLDCDTGELDPTALRADITLTFAAAKRGQFRFPAADYIGELIVADIGVPADQPELAAVTLELAAREDIQSLLPARPRDAHKGTFGRSLVVAGSINYTGAAMLSAAAAYRSGAGLVTLAVPMPIYPALAPQIPEATWILLPHEMGVIASGAVKVLSDALKESQSVLLGPGWGMEKETGDFLRKLLRAEEPGKKRGGLGFVHTEDESPDEAAVLPPAVVDADGLKHLAEIDDWPSLLPRPSVLTPHPGEMAVLTKLEKEAIQADRLGVAQKFAAEWGHIVVLKGAFTVIAAPDGRATIQPFATPALAHAGTGDVLAGAIAGLMAQGVKPYEAAVAGAFLHGLAGEIAAEDLGTTVSVMAGDVLDALPTAIATVEA